VVPEAQGQRIHLRSAPMQFNGPSLRERAPQDMGCASRRFKKLFKVRLSNRIFMNMALRIEQKQLFHFF
jgi:hypothetical protein